MTTREGYSRCVKNVKTLLNPSGYFVTIGDLKDPELHMENFTFKCVLLNSDVLKAAYSESGFEFNDLQVTVNKLLGQTPVLVVVNELLITQSILSTSFKNYRVIPLFNFR